MLTSPTALLAADAAGRSPTWIAGSITVLTLVLAGWVAFIWWMRGLVLTRLKQLAIEKSRVITSQSLRRVSAKRLVQLASIGTRLFAVAAVLVGLFTWAVAVLDSLATTHALALRIESAVLTQLEELALAGVRTVPDLMIIGVIFFATRLVHEFLNHYFRSIAEGEVESRLFDEVTAETTRRLADFGVWIAAIIIAFPYIPGSDSAAFRGVTVLAGLMLSLGSANLVGQFASGLGLIYGRAVRPGEYIQCGEFEGLVEHVGLFSCRLRSPRDEIVVLPNSAVAAGLKNFSRQLATVRYTTEVTIGYDAPWQQVHELLLGAAADTAGLRREPAPSVRQAALEDFYVRYELQFTPEDPAARTVLLGRVHAAIQERFHRAGVQIMSPNYRADPDAPKIPPPWPA